MVLTDISSGRVTKKIGTSSFFGVADLQTISKYMDFVTNAFVTLPLLTFDLDQGVAANT